MQDKWDEVEALPALMPERKTLAEVADHRASIQQAHALSLRENGRVAKMEKGFVNKAIHSFGGEGAVMDALGSGMTIEALSRSLGFSPSSFYDWVERGGEARADLVSRARARGAHSLAEETISIADAADRDTVQVAKLRSDNRWRLAAKLNPEAYGERQAEININLGDVTLAALRKREITDVIDVTPVNESDADT